MKKIIKYILGLILVLVLLFGFYIYKLHALAIKGNNIYSLRCTKVNVPLIKYKDSFLKFADCIKTLKCTKEEFWRYMADYNSGMRSYVSEETKWLETEKQYMNSWDFKLFEPWYIKQGSEYQWKMYEGYRDDAQYMLDVVDKKLTEDQLKVTYPEPRQRRDKYIQLYFELYEKALTSKDWRKIFSYVPIPEGCTEENLTIPDTSGALDSPTPPPSIIHIENGPIS